MANEVTFYRKWRPQRFAEVLGQTLVVETLRRAVVQGRLSHAYLFAGQRGVGKTSVARILARAVNCLAPREGEPCNECENCLRILSGKCLDMVEIDGASNRGIDQIRRLREEVNYVPTGARYKVYIIDEVHMLTNEAFNALLKTLEEPPPHVIFIFATTEPQKVPPTILSRCQVFEFTPLPEELIEKKLVGIADAEGVELSPGAAKLIARRAEGSLRDAEVLLEQLAHSGPVREENVVALLGLPPLAELDRFLDALRNKNAVVALDVVEKHLERGRDLGLFLEEAALRARDRILAGEGDLVELARRLFSWRAEIPKTVSPRLHLELEILSLCGAPTRPIHEPSVSSPKAAELLAEAPQVKKSRGIGEEGPTEVESPEGGSASVAVDGVGSAETGETGPGALFAPTTEDGGEEVLKSSGSRKWPIPEEFDNPWDQLITAALADRVAVATFLLPAEVEFRDGILTITLPEGYRFHYEMLRELEVRRYVEELARRFFQPLLSLRIEYVGEEREKLSLEEGAELLARYLEGRVVKEGG